MRTTPPRWPYRVLQVMAGAPVGGIETFFFDAVLALSEAGLEQAAVVRPNAPYQIGRLRDANIRVVTTAFSPWFIFPSRAAMMREIASFKPDIIQYWTGRAAMTAVKSDATEVGWYGGYRDRWRYASCSDFIGITKDLVQHIQRQGVAFDHVSLVHTFADPRPSKPVERGAFNTPAGAPLLLVLARLHRDKALDILLDALADVPQAYLWIAGEGPERAALVAQTKRLNLSERVRFLGWRNDREALLATADICVFPSREEPFGTVTIEAWAAGTPLIAAAAQGPAAYVEDGKNGLLVPIDDAPALASAIDRLISDRAFGKTLANAARAEYERNFTKEIYVRDMQTFYDRLARRARRRTSSLP
ncbi:MAG: glycosyltransferase [Terriglobia bacterium]|nr:glycosyltransferase [Terriglobia bacterium]